MKIIVLGLEGVDPARLLGDPGLVHLRSVIDLGVFGTLSELPGPGSGSPWHAIATGKDPDPPGRDRAPVGPMLWDLLGPGPRPPAPLLVDGSCGSGAGGRHREGGGDDAIASTRERFSVLRNLMRSRPWLFAQLIDDTLAATGPAAPDVADHWFATFDEELGLLLEQAADEVTVLIVATGQPGAFVLATSRAIRPGRLDGIRLIDLPPTLLAIAGRPIPDSMAGTPLGITAVDEPLADEEELVLERLRGLGYLN